MVRCSARGDLDLTPDPGDRSAPLSGSTPGHPGPGIPGSPGPVRPIRLRPDPNIRTPSPASATAAAAGTPLSQTHHRVLCVVIRAHDDDDLHLPSLPFSESTCRRDDDIHNNTERKAGSSGTNGCGERPGRLAGWADTDTTLMFVCC